MIQPKQNSVNSVIDLKNLVKLYYSRDKFFAILRENGVERNVEIDYSPYKYLYIDKADYNDKLKNYADLSPFKVDFRLGKKYCRINYQKGNWKDIVKVFNKLGISKTYEADVYPYKRILLDNDVSFGEPKYLYIDIEVDDRVKNVDRTNRRILSIAYSDGSKDGILILEKDSDDAEADLLKKFIKLARGYDVLVAWNGEEFDFPIIRGKVIKYNAEEMYNVGIRELDFMQVFDKYWMGGADVKKSLSLDNVSKEVLGREKIKLDESIYAIWRDKRELLERYNKNDVNLMVELEKQTKFIESANILANICNSFIETNSLKANYLVDSYLLKLSRQQGIRLISKSVDDKVVTRDDIKGAYCDNFRTGYLENVDLYDFKSLYPSIILSFNISFETKVSSSYQGETYITANNVRFMKSPTGLFSIMEKTALDMRDRYKKDGKAMIANAWKILANSLAGVTALPYSRYYDPDIFEAISQTGSELIQKVIQNAKDRGIGLVFSDTDSVAVVSDEKSKILGDKSFLNDIVKSRFGIDNRYFDLKYEGKFEKIIITSKKRYIAIKDGKYIVKGLEIVRTDTCRLARQLQKEVCDLIFSGKGLSDVLKYVDSYRDKVYSGDVDLGDIAIYKKITKEEYKSELVHTKLARKLKDEFGRDIYLGMKIGYIITESEPKLNGKLLEEFDIKKDKYDVNYYWQKLIYPATERILLAVWGNQIKKTKESSGELFPLIQSVQEVKGVVDDGVKEVKEADNKSNNSEKIDLEVGGLSRYMMLAINLTGMDSGKMAEIKKYIDRYKSDTGQKIIFVVNEGDMSTYLISEDTYDTIKIIKNIS